MVDAMAMNALKLVSVLQQGSGAPVFLQLAEEVPGQMALPAGVAVELGRKAAVGSGRDECLDPCVRRRLARPVRVECSIREELAAGQPFFERRSAAQVVGLAGQQPDIDQVAERIGQCRDPGGHAAVRTSDGLTSGHPFVP